MMFFVVILDLFDLIEFFDEEFSVYDEFRFYFDFL